MKDALTERTSAMAAGQRPAWADRVAHRLIDRQLQNLRHGRLTVVSPMGTRTYGRSDELTATVHMDAPAFRQLLTGGTLAAARSYVRGEWRADDLTAACRVLARNLDVADGLERGWARLTKPFFAAAHWARRNTRRGSRRNIEAHYDLGNDFFQLFLDETMTYSCAVFEPDTATLADASRAKIDRLCRKLDLRPDDHLVEIGTGWGAFAIHAASRYGCRVTTTTISRQQHELASRRVAEAGLSDRITVLLSDYRDLTGAYDKLVSVEMIEAVGADFLDTFFAQCARLVRPGGRIAMQAITIPDARYADYVRSVDFIRQDVFPGSCLVSVAAMQASADRTRTLRAGEVEDLTPHYARTLRTWRENFLRRLDEVRALGYSEEFIRRWELYLASCEAGFAERTTGLVQVVWAKVGPGSAGGQP
jgi:cyclopropane-fatty-acyl-phospholipid synthase